MIKLNHFIILILLSGIANLSQATQAVPMQDENAAHFFRCKQLAEQEPLVRLSEMGEANRQLVLSPKHGLQRLAFEFLGYSQLCRLKRTSNQFKEGADAAFMKKGRFWVDWMRGKIDKGASAEALANEVVGALFRCPWNFETAPPLNVLGDVIALTFPWSTGMHGQKILSLGRVFGNRTFEETQSGHRALVGELLDSYATAKKLPPLAKSHQINDQLVGRAEQYIALTQPYAVAHIMHQLLTLGDDAWTVGGTLEFISPLAVPPMPHSAAQWVEGKIDARALQDFLHYVRACLRVDMAKVATHTNTELYLSMPRTCDQIVSIFDSLELSYDTIAAEDQFIELLKYYVERTDSERGLVKRDSSYVWELYCKFMQDRKDIWAGCYRCGQLMILDAQKAVTWQVSPYSMMDIIEHGQTLFEQAESMSMSHRIKMYHWIQKEVCEFIAQWSIKLEDRHCHCSTSCHEFRDGLQEKIIAWKSEAKKLFDAIEQQLQLLNGPYETKNNPIDEEKTQEK